MQIPIPSRVRVHECSACYEGSSYLRQDKLEAPTQLSLPFYGKTLDVDGMTDPKYGEQIRYMGKATHVFDNVYRCIAVVGGALCAVEVTIRHDRNLRPES